MTTERRQKGLTLIELLVSAAVLGVVMIFVLRIFTNQHQTYTVIDQVAEVQQNGRAIAQMIERDIRAAGYMAPRGAAVCGADAQDGPDVLIVSDSQVILPVDELPLELRSLELGAEVSGAGTGWQLAAGSRSIAVANLFVDTAAGGDDFAVDAGLILTDRNAPFGNVGCGKITDITGNTITFDLLSDFGPVGSGAEVVAVPAHVYEVDGSRLLRDGHLIVAGVEDLQIAYFFDLDDDRQLDAGEFFGNGSAPGYASDSALIDGVRLREVRFNVVVATRMDDPRREFQLGRRQVTENRTAASTAGADGKRRRVHTATVRLRNGVS
jgi:prepilin-type N-terminal cleavage/methylation domain-containing protein